MTFSYEKRSPGDVLSSQDWNAAMQEIVRMETAKVNRNGADTLKGPLTIVEALTVSGNMGLGKPASNDVRLDIKGDLRVTEGSINANLLVRDTRDVNDSPTAFDRVVSFDFKKRDVVGAPGEGNFSGMLTIAPWTDNSGDAHHQLNFNEGGIFWRQGQPDATSWDQWRRIPHEGMTSSFTLQGNLGVGLTNPGQPLVINSTHNSGRQAGSGMNGGGAIAISSNAPQIDFIDTDTGHGDWAIHVNTSKLYFIREPWNYQDLVLDGVGRVGIGTDTPQAKLQVVGGAIMPSVGNSTTAGIFFPTDPGGGGGDAAWLRYYMRSGEAGTLELGISNDGDDHLALMASGGVGIGTNTPEAKLDVIGGIRARSYKTRVLSAEGVGAGAISLTNANTWNLFPNLSQTFSLSETTAVIAFYQIAMGGGSHLVTRLVVDNSVVSRTITGDTNYWSNSEVWFGELSAGSHTIRVEYRTPKGGSQNPSNSDWENRVLRVIILGV
jgi:hypothetical protein